MFPFESSPAQSVRFFHYSQDLFGNELHPSHFLNDLPFPPPVVSGPHEWTLGNGQSAPASERSSVGGKRKGEQVSTVLSSPGGHSLQGAHPPWPCFRETEPQRPGRKGRCHRPLCQPRQATATPAAVCLLPHRALRAPSAARGAWCGGMAVTWAAA